MSHPRKRRLFANLPVHVDELVGKGREFVAETDGVYSAVRRCECVGVELAFDLAVDDLLVGSFQRHIHIIGASCHHLETPKDVFIYVVIT